MQEIVGRTGLARILGVSVSTTRNLEARGAIAPDAIVEGRPVYSADKAKQLRVTLDAKRAQRRAERAA